MKMKTKNNKRSAKKLIIILSLCLALVLALGAATYAWIRNYVDINTLNLETGEMIYKVTMYRVSGGKADAGMPIFDSETDSVEGENFEKNISNGLIANVSRDEELFFIIEKDEKSIEIDASIAFDNLGLDSDYTDMGQVKYQICDEQTAITNVASYLATPGANTGTLSEGLSNIFHITQKTSLPEGKDYACIRLKLDRPATDGTDLKLPLRVKLCVAQKDKLPIDTNPDIFEIYGLDDLKGVMGEYGVGDEIRIMEDVDYEGDLIFTRPCKLTIMHSTLTVKGNLSFAYMYDGSFELNTVSEGQIRIVKTKPDSNEDRAGGNFRIDLPNSKIDILGANDDEAGKADIYVEEGFVANAANIPDKGISFKGARICDIDSTVTKKTENGNDVYTYEYMTRADLKSITVNGPSRIAVSLRTRLGEIQTNIYCKSITIENNGYIAGINLENMVCDNTFTAAPAILIDNAGSVGESEAESNIILLPEGSKKFKVSDNSSPADNVQIKASKGSQTIRALTKNSGDSVDTFDNVESRSAFFFSPGSGVGGKYDDIEYDHREVFVEADENDNTKITIHYETPSSQFTEPVTFTGLKSYVDYYSRKGIIAPANKLTDVTVICYGDKVLKSTTTANDPDVDDYEFIRTMKSLKTLDLSDAVSTNKIVPKDAFKNMTSLMTLKMSESDTVWGQYIFTGTGVKSITFPQSLKKLDNPINNLKKVSAQNVLDGIKYVYTSVSTVDGFWYTDNIKNLKQHLFTPDEQTCAAYRNLYDIENNDSDENWKSRIFLDNGAVNYNGFFLRLNNDPTNRTCEFVTYTEDRDANGERLAWIDETGFNFQTIKIDGGDPYTIIKYDPYALYGKLIEPKSQIEDISNRVNSITLLASVTEIGERAFANNKITSKSATGEILEVGFDTVTIEGDPDIRGYAFSDNDALETFNASNLTKLYGGYNLSKNSALTTFNVSRLRYVYADGDISECENLKDVHISLIEKTDVNKNFYTSSDNYFYARFYIHTDYSDMSYSQNFEKALAADLRHIFVKESYAELYKNSGYTGVTEMGENNLDQLLRADENGNSLPTEDENGNPIDPAGQPNLKYYYILDGGNARLVAHLYDKKQDSKLGEVVSELGGKPINYIGSAAYHFTPMVADEITIPSAVTKIGDYAFDSRGSAAKKYCITLNLNNVIAAGKGAFYYMDMAKVAGNALTTVGEDTFTRNQSLAVINLPNLQNSRGGDPTNPVSTVFKYAKKLRVMYVSYSVDIEYDNDHSRIKNYIRFMNVINVPTSDSIPVFANKDNATKAVNTVMKANIDLKINKHSSFDNAFIQVSDWDLIKVSNYYDYVVDLGEIKGSIEIPGYIYHQIRENGEENEKVTELSLIATSPDVGEFGNFTNNKSDYITPGYLYLDSGKYTDKGNGESKIKVTSIDKYAFGTASFNNINEFVIADTVKILSDFALAGYAPIYSTVNENAVDKYVVTLSDVFSLNLSEVSSVGKRACYNATIERLNSALLASIGESAFENCKALKQVFLPSYATADANGNTFKNCWKLDEVTFGKSIQYLVKNMFYGCSELDKITILKDDTALTSCQPLVASTTAGDKIILSVPKSVLAGYQSNFKNGFGYIPMDNFVSFENASTYDDITYYWNVVSDVDGNRTAYIDYIYATSFDSELTIPSKVQREDEYGNKIGPEYTVIFVAAQAMKTLDSNVSTVELPSGMQYLTFSTEDLADTVTTLVISSDNSKFGTLDGVLYGKDADGDLTTLLVYPKAKAATEVTLASTVTEIASGAFYGAKNLKTLNIGGNVTIYDRAFEGSSISTINFTKTTGVSVFAGRDIFNGVNLSTLNIFVPSGTLESYKANVLVDYEIVERFFTGS